MKISNRIIPHFTCVFRFDSLDYCSKVNQIIRRNLSQAIYLNFNQFKLANLQHTERQRESKDTLI